MTQISQQVAHHDGSPGRPAEPLSAQSAVAELGQAALDGLPVAEIFRLAIDRVGDILDVEYAKVLRSDEPGEPLVLVAGRGWGPSVRIGETAVPCSEESQAGFTLQSSEPVIVEDLAEEQRFAGPDLLLDHGVVSGLSVLIPGPHGPFGVLGAHTARRRRFSCEDAAFLRSVANILGSAVQNDLARKQIQSQAAASERRLAYQQAVAECAQHLLANGGETRLRKAVDALLRATEAAYVFVERNVFDPELGFCSRTVVEVGQDGSRDRLSHDDYWRLVPWDRMPVSRAHLETGEPFFLVPTELEGVEAEQYRADPNPIMAELDIPIFVNGEWAGLIGFADTSMVRTWEPEDVTLLTTAASMIGSFWERGAARQRLEDMIRAKDQFLASVSHELRTPLTAVVGFGEILQESSNYVSVEERQELLETVVTHGRELTNLVNDLLIAARADLGTLQVKQVPVNLRAQAAQVVEEYGPEPVGAMETDGPPVRAIGDPDRVRQIIRNLVSNAQHYGGSRIEIRFSENDGKALVAVADNGKPIPTEDRDRIFEPYQKAHHKPGIDGSLGLGLAISRRLARLMGGDLTYDHVDGESVFELTLPPAG